MPNAPFPPLETARLHVRCIALDDAEATAMMMTPEISRWVASWPIPFTPAMAAKRIRSSRKAAEEGDALPFAVIEKAGGALVGWVVIHRDGENPRRGAISYWFGERHHGKGYMRELAAIVMATGFEQLDLDVIEAIAQQDNAASLAVMRICGMQPAGERMFYASAREQYEPCLVHEARRPTAR